MTEERRKGNWRMTVWLLTYGSGAFGDEWGLISIHSTKEKAEAAKAEYEKPTLGQNGLTVTNYAEVEEWEVND